MRLPLSTTVHPVTNLLTVNTVGKNVGFSLCTKEQNALFEFTNLNGRKRSRKEVSKILNASIRDLGSVLHEGGGPQIGEVTCGGSPHLSCKRDQIKMRDYVDRRVTHQSGLPHLPGVPHLHVNRPLDYNGLALLAEIGKRSLIEFYLVPQH